MKRIISLSLALLTMAALLGGCTPAGEAKPSKTPEEMTALYVSAIENARDEELNQVMPITSSVDDDTAALMLPLMGISAENTAAFAVSASIMNVKAYGVALILPAEGKHDEVLEGVNNFVDTQQRNFQNYLPDQFAVASDAKVETLDDGTILLVMSEDANTVADSIKGTLGA